jgi:prolyl 4-hydroxylase
MKILIAVPLLWIFGIGVDSFSTSSPRLNGTPLHVSTQTQTVTVTVADNGVHAATNFWGEPRNEQEIIDFVSNAVFYNEVEASLGYFRSDVQDQWVEVISAEPPLFVVHGFLERNYCDQIIAATLGPTSSDSDCSDDDDAPAKHQLKRSTMGAEQEASDHRTSSTAWLHEEHCEFPLRTFTTRTAALSGLPPTNMENMQVVQYQPGEEFQEHTDHLDSFNEFGCGGRLCTCLVYLNDPQAPIKAQNNYLDSLSKNYNTMGREETAFTGGETNFPEFGRAITPKKGSALFFWNTLERPGSMNYDEDMFLNVDTKLRHAGLPVLSGEKWVANRWIHPRQFGADVRGLV